MGLITNSTVTATLLAILFFVAFISVTMYSISWHLGRIANALEKLAK